MSQTRLNVFSSVDGASIPKTFHVAAQVTQEVPQERQDFLAGEVGRVELDIPSQATTGGRDGDSRNRRDPVPFVAVPEPRGLADRRPRLGHSGDKQEAAFIEKDQVRVPRVGFFVYAARSSSSSVQSPLRPAGSHGVRVFASSTLIPQTSHARREWTGSESRNVCGSLLRPVSTSRDRWNSRRPAILSAESASAVLSAPRTSGRVVLRSALAATRAGLAAGTCDTSGRPNLYWHSAWRRPFGRACPLSASQWLDVFAFPTAGAFHEVSCPIHVSIIYRKINMIPVEP